MELEYNICGFCRIVLERRRQINEENFTEAKDDLYKNRELMKAAHCYANRNPDGWPWDISTFKLNKDNVYNYIKAGALYLAERDRYLRGGFYTFKLDGNLPELMKLKAIEMGERIDSLQTYYDAPTIESS